MTDYTVYQDLVTDTSVYLVSYDGLSRYRVISSTYSVIV